MKIKINISFELIDKIPSSLLEKLEKQFKQTFKDIESNCVLILDIKSHRSKRFEVNIYIPESVEKEVDTKLRAFLITVQALLKPLTEQLQQGIVVDFHCLEVKNSEVVKGSKRENLPYRACKPIYDWSRVVLPETTLGELQKTVKFLKRQEVLYTHWGFKEIEPNPRMVLNFYGPPGTGKTITAHAFANDLGMNLIFANYAQIESKYVGEAPKHLEKLFEDAKKQNALIFFDEADVILGKRLESVSSTADQETNALKSQLLILLEQFEGIVIFATNFLKNYDEAFRSRIFQHIYFPLPDKSLRKRLIAKHIPPNAPLSFPLNDFHLEILAIISEGFSGRDIKNAVKDALITALVEDRVPIPFELFREAFLSYKRKITLTGEDGKISSTNAEFTHSIDLNEL